MNEDKSHRLARLSLDGLSVGDAFGELFFRISPEMHTNSTLPPGPWPWTDDTHMAISIVENLKKYGRIDQDALAEAFARRFMEQPLRGYGGGAARLLRAIAGGEDWRKISPRLFGEGSYGNGAAMRASPIGGFFFGRPEKASQEARLSAEITHSHLEGQAGAMAVAAAASIAATRPPFKPKEFLESILFHLPESITRQRIRLALEIPGDNLQLAQKKLGTGYRVSAQDTVPFCLWSAAYHLYDFEAALWWTARGKGDCDTTCAIVGGIVALSAPEIPQEWLKKREPLPKI